MVSFIHAYELILGLYVFRQTGPPQLVDCLVPPLVCYMKMEASRKVPSPGTQQGSLPACSLYYHYVLSVRYGSREYHFLKSFGMTRLGK